MRFVIAFQPGNFLFSRDPLIDISWLLGEFPSYGMIPSRDSFPAVSFLRNPPSDFPFLFVLGTSLVSCLMRAWTAFSSH